MFKQIKILLTMLLIGQVLGVVFIQADNTLTVGNSFTYEVIESEWSFIVGDLETNGDGFRFNDQMFSSSEFIIATVNEIDYNYAEFTIEVGEEFGIYSFSQLFAFYFIGLATHPFDMLIGATYWIINDDPLYLELQHMYYFPHNSLEDFFTLLENETFISEEYINDEYYTYNNVRGNFDDVNDIVVLTWEFDAQYIDDDHGTNYGGTYGFIIEYDKISGLLQRYRIDFDYSGSYEYYSIDLESHQEIELQGYTQETSLPALISISILTLMAIFAIANRKRKC
ncbi:MAG: hypothetical protein JXA54_15675 [Candidatus Heimdallarchaeota archaeon]|nr:hypothetical protein [Candidatus Heimdallarchaeota archaeon]